MRIKIHILTILAGVLTVLSFYLVITDAASRPDIAQADDQDSSFLKSPSFVQTMEGGPGRTLSQKGAFILPISEPTYFPLRDTAVSVPELTAKSWLIFDTKNEKIIFSKEPSRALPVASLTKLLTAVISLENLNVQDMVTITSSSFNVDGEGADFRLGEQFYFKDLFGAMLVKSSNDAAQAIAKAVEQKTGENFTGLMNRLARQIGMRDSHFLDPAGLNDEGYSTARDLLRLVRYAKNYAAIRPLLGLPFLDIVSVGGKSSYRLESTNKLWGVLPNLIGGKTGYTDGALGCMIIEENLPDQGSSLVVIVLGSADRFGEVQKLIDWSKSSFRWR